MKRQEDQGRQMLQLRTPLQNCQPPFLTVSASGKCLAAACRKQAHNASRKSIFVLWHKRFFNGSKYLVAFIVKLVVVPSTFTAHDIKSTLLVAGCSLYPSQMPEELPKPVHISKYPHTAILNRVTWCTLSPPHPMPPHPTITHPEKQWHTQHL